eukprot:2898-Amphidinium_carterae.1
MQGFRIAARGKEEKETLTLVHKAFAWLRSSIEVKYAAAETCSNPASRSKVVSRVIGGELHPHRHTTEEFKEKPSYDASNTD